MVFGIFSRNKSKVNLASPIAEPSNEEFPPASPSPAPALLDDDNAFPVDVEVTAANVEEMHALVRSVPPKILHEYVLSRLDSGTEPNDEDENVLVMNKDTVRALIDFFVDLSPPPRLHCVRCHKGYFDVENTDTSCQIQHDDESAEVERVGTNGKGKDRAAAYETLWGCCGNTVPGDGDMGPPDGWCYEGKHTTDTKRARFRADSSIHDDKLVSCKRCPSIVAPRAGTSSRSGTTRKRGYSSSSQANSVASSSSNAPSAADDSGLEDIVKSSKKRKIQNRGKGHSRAVDREREKQRSEEKERAKKRVRRASVLPGADPETGEEEPTPMEVDASVGSITTTLDSSTKPKKPRAPRRKKVTVEVQIPTSPVSAPPSPAKKPKSTKQRAKGQEMAPPPPGAPRGLDEIVPSSVGEEDWDWGTSQPRK